MAARKGHICAHWEVPLSDGVHRVEFEHGTTTGRRVIYVDNKVVFREDFMFKLVGSQQFKIGPICCSINIDAVSGLAYEYTMFVNGKPLEKFTESQSKVLKCWVLPVDGAMKRIVLEKDTLEVYVNGDKVETAGEFTDDGTETHFSINAHSCCIKAISSGRRRTGIIHYLLMDDCEVPEAAVDQYNEWGMQHFVE